MIEEGGTGRGRGREREGVSGDRQISKERKAGGQLLGTAASTDVRRSSENSLDKGEGERRRVKSRVVITWRRKKKYTVARQRDAGANGAT